MFKVIESEVSSRITEIRKTLMLIDPTSLAFSKDEVVQKVNKGLLFVSLYGTYEYAVTATLSHVIDCINSSTIEISKLKPILLSLSLNSECDSLCSVGRKTKWEKRNLLFLKIYSNDIVNIPNELIPTDGANIKYKQLDSIQKTFCLHKSILPDPKYGARIAELVDNRNKIAHGNFSASTVGNRYTLSTLTEIITDIEYISFYIINVFEEYIVQKQYSQNNI